MTGARKLFITLVLVTVLAAAVIPTVAQSTAAITWTEDDINSLYRVTNPGRRSVSKVSVDLQPDVVVIAATVTLRGKAPVEVVTTLTPNISNGRITWAVEAVTKAGQPVAQDILNQINTSIAASWRRYVKENSPAGRVSGIEITDDELTISFSRGR